MAFVILVVEDNEMNRELLIRRLQKRGYEVLAAANGKDALDMASREAPDMILMDMCMPIMDGWTTVRQLKAIPETQNIPVIGVSANGLHRDQEEAMAAGCVAFEAKPIDFNRLLSLIQDFGEKAS
ncbi:MAG: response regulator [Pseudobdellovibrionaceae bacterium]|nr:response regulator [Pseudobdellovibrionaceae bacterium]